MNGFREPMLAHTLKDGPLPAGHWVGEQKYDGMRVVIVKLSGSGPVFYSRLGNDQRKLVRPEIARQMNALADGIYDGELYIPGGTSSDVKDLNNVPKQRLVLFDILSYRKEDIAIQTWSSRRTALESAIAEASDLAMSEIISLSPYVPVRSRADVEQLAETIWEEGGEGLILKDMSAPYRCGKRSKAFLKVKDIKSAVLEVVGFAPTEGEIMHRGDFACAVVKDEEGITTVVKTIDDAELARMTKEFGTGIEQVRQSIRLSSGKKLDIIVNHPRVGSLLRIDYQQRTPDGNYRHPRWDRWECE